MSGQLERMETASSSDDDFVDNPFVVRTRSRPGPPRTAATNSRKRTATYLSAEVRLAICW